MTDPQGPDAPAATPEPTVKRRGPYRKNPSRRDEILDAALLVFGKAGYRSGSVREIAKLVGLTAPGLLHYFGSKHALLIEVLRHREEIDHQFAEGADLTGANGLIWLVKTAERNSERRGLVELFCVLSAEATDVDHPAHEYFVQRYEWLRHYVGHAFGQLAAAGELRPGVDAAEAARTTLAVMDGLQVQWLLNATAVDMPGDLRAYFRGLLVDGVWDRAEGLPSGATPPPAPPVPVEPPPSAVPPAGLGTGEERGTTIQDIARLAGVSIASVSRALNDKPGVSPATRTAVLRVAQEQGFTGNAMARALKSGLTGRIAIILPWVHIEYAGRILEGASEVLQANGQSLSVTTTGSDFGRLASVVGQLSRQRFDGAIHVLPFGAAAEFRELASSGFPVVFVDPAVELGLPFPVVACDNAAGGCLATEHLLSLGHTRIGVIAGEAGTLATGERLRGVRETLAEAGIAFDETLLRHGRMQAEDGFTSAMSLLSAPGRPTALFAFTDRLAAGALRAARGLGIDVPSQLSVVGFDDEDSAALVIPSLTTVRQPLAQMGSTAAHLLLDWLGGHDRRDARVTLPVELMIRASTAVVGR